ncbi:IspD/TarI family cytidylyltransferase [Pseudonocardia humida]|uniref:2-C-methyl-D-erythritol 4-phosphate cytidylyltransferase n=1 Tax=Pseudonocardia humida TaxID=2800819 RepID=A0ABT0ZWZ9_9PSEU|nr:2-C-methyl-D-erythritol 4-phosphate cytidylyltransferase [Pseudonocardia humida]MCO1655184.1 2-C-methyl-D-erythritol 4-phosphate cytidylyltransferase [Pseudonocardia humida]
MNVDAVVVASGVPGAVDALTPVGGVPMIARSVRALLAGLSTTERSDRVIVVAPAGRRDAIERACAGLPVDVRETVPVAAGRARSGEAHVGQRTTPSPGDGLRDIPHDDPVTILHDAARPLAPPALVAAVLAEAATGCAAVVPVLPLTDTVKLVDPAGIVTATPDRADLRVLQTPQVVRTALLDPAEDPFATILRLAARGHVRHVPGDPAAFPVLTAWDLRLAELLVH